MQCCLLSRKLAKYRTDREAESGKVAFGQNIAGHDFPGRINILERPAFTIYYSPVLVYRDTHIRKSDTWFERKSIEWRAVNGHSPVTFAGFDTASCDAVQHFHFS